jgi:hypothetical protein
MRVALSSLLFLSLAAGGLPAQAASSQAQFDPVAGVWVAGRLDSTSSPAGRVSGLRPEIQNRGGVQVIKSFPFPPGWLYGRDIAWDGASLWIGENFNSRIYEIDPDTGGVLSSFFGPNSNPWGLAFDGTNLLHATITLAGPPPDNLPDDVYVLTRQGGVLDTWLAPDSPNANAHGCAYDPATGSLWLSDSESNTIYELDPTNGAIRSSFAAPGSEVRGLAFDGQYLWVIDYDTLSLIQFDFSGNVQYTVSIATLGNDPEGLEFDGQYLWITENENDLIYQVDPGQPCQLEVELGRNELRAGDRLPFRVALHHQRLKAVTVPFAMWIENDQGQVIFKQRSQPYAMHFGDVVEFRGELALPAATPPGNYSLKVGTTKMQQGVAWESQPFRIVP